MNPRGGFYCTFFLPATPLSLSHTLEGLFESKQRSSRANLRLVHCLLNFRNSLCGEVPVEIRYAGRYRSHSVTTGTNLDCAFVIILFDTAMILHCKKPTESD